MQARARRYWIDVIVFIVRGARAGGAIPLEVPIAAEFIIEISLCLRDGP